MSKQVKITINNKECYCDNEVLEYILRISNKMEELEYNRDKAVEYLDKNPMGISYKEISELLYILKGEYND